jgi:hypothetical protein
MSARALCETCSITRQGESVAQMMTRSGPYYDEWRRAMVEMAHRLVLESR